MTLLPRLDPLHKRWSALGSRERTAIWLAATLVLAAACWQLLLAPALSTLRTADLQGRALDTQIQQMLTLQKQAQALQAQPPLSLDEAVRSLTQATRQTLGTSAEMTVVADRAKVTLKAASADSLARWLTQARLNAKSLPQEVRLTSLTANGATTWSGTVFMGLPQR
ncbi:MAG: type II secretion system protein M [Rhodoferax sp.]|nr:type II secretion system protein M [Rhodoferax sp.]MCF8208348.1 type II secretion system protein M [Rhodoferax sp.]